MRFILRLTGSGLLFLPECKCAFKAPLGHTRVLGSFRRKDSKSVESIKNSNYMCTGVAGKMRGGGGS